MEVNGGSILDKGETMFDLIFPNPAPTASLAPTAAFFPC